MFSEALSQKKETERKKKNTPHRINYSLIPNSYLGPGPLAKGSTAFAMQPLQARFLSKKAHRM
jgi:hypothetical protein